MAAPSRKLLTNKQVTDGLTKALAEIRATKDERKNHFENRKRLEKQYFTGKSSEQKEGIRRYARELSDHFREEKARIESALEACARKIASQKEENRKARNILKVQEILLDSLKVQKSDYSINPNDEAIIRNLKALMKRDPKLFQVFMEGEPGTDYIQEVKAQYDEIKAHLDRTQEMISNSRAEIEEQVMVQVRNEFLPKIEQTLDEQQKFAQEEAEEFTEMYESYQLEKEQLEEEIRSLKESKERTEAALEDLQERSTRKQSDDRKEIETLQANLEGQQNEMETAKQEHDRAMSAERDLHTLAMEKARKEHAQALDAAQNESDRRLAEARAEHTQVMDKSQKERTQAMNQFRVEHEQVLSKAQGEYAQALQAVRAEHAQAVNNAEKRSTTKSKIIASNFSVLHRTEADGEQRINELCELLEGMQILATHQLSPYLFPNDRRLDSTNTDIEWGLTIVAGDLGALFLFAKDLGIYMFRAEDLEYVLVARCKLMLVFRGGLGLPEKLRSISLCGADSSEDMWDFVWGWRKAYLDGVVDKMED